MEAPSGSQPDLRLTAVPDGSWTILTVTGELDLVTAGEFGDGLREHLAEGPVLLDLGELMFMDSSGVRTLGEILRDAGREGWTLGVRPEMRPNVRQVLDITGMMGVLPMHQEQA